MNCGDCKDLLGKPIPMVRIYVKKTKTRMNKGGYQGVGWLCPQCKKTTLDVKL